MKVETEIHHILSTNVGYFKLKLNKAHFMNGCLICLKHSDRHFS